MNALLRLLATGTAVGLVVLGVGGRIAMSAIQAASNTTPSRWTVGGTLMVLGLGAASGLAGAALLALSRWIARKLVPLYEWLHYPLVAALLLLITLCGLRGSAPVGRVYFIPLVATYAVVTVWLDRRWARPPAQPGPPA